MEVEGDWKLVPFRNSSKRNKMRNKKKTYEKKQEDASELKLVSHSNDKKLYSNVLLDKKNHSVPKELGYSIDQLDKLKKCLDECYRLSQSSKPFQRQLLACISQFHTKLTIV
jgi:hypothetical protein